MISKTIDVEALLVREKVTSEALIALMRTSTALRGLGALTDLVNRTQEVFSLSEDGDQLIAKVNGKIEYGKDGQALSMDEWILSLRENAGHLLMPAEVHVLEL